MRRGPVLFAGEIPLFKQWIALTGVILLAARELHGLETQSNMRFYMKTFFACLLVGIAAFSVAAQSSDVIRLTDGKTFKGWEGDTKKTWRIENGAFVGGSMETTVPRNEFLATERGFTNFVLRLKFKLVGTEGFINGGVQVRSQRITNPPNEMIGYQCDMGDGFWGALYDESRRNKILVKPEPAAVEKALKKNEWNEYLIRCEGKRIRTWINDVPMIDYTEPDDSIPQFGLIGLQIHSGAKAEASYKDITIQELP
jgi:hypothetical protein